MKKRISSLMQKDMSSCYLCGTTLGLEEHHAMHGTANRKNADNLGLTVMLCHNCHTGADYSVHKNRETDLHIIKQAQMCFEEHFCRDAWMKIFKKNYL